MADTRPDTPPPGSGGGLGERVFGLPKWGWAGMAVAGGVLVWVWWRGRGSSDQSGGSDTAVYPQGLANGLGTDQFESLYAILRDLQGRLSNTPPEGGDPLSPGDGVRTPPWGSGPPPLTPIQVPPAPVPSPAPVTPTAPAGQFVTVVRYTTPNPPWNSTLWGIAQHYGTSVARLLQLNPWIANPNVVKPGWQIRYA